MSPVLALFRKQLGDVLLLQPTLNKLARAYGTEVELATRDGFDELLSLMPGIVPARPGPFKKYSAVYAFDSKPRSTLLAAMVRSPVKHLLYSRDSQLKAHHAWVFNHREKAPDGSFYRAQYYFRNTPTPNAIDFQPPQLQQPPADWFPDHLPQRYLLIHPTSAWQEKCWLSERWAALLHQLLEVAGLPALLTTGNADWERAYGADIKRQGPKNLIDISGTTSLKQYLAIVSRAEMVLCIDGSASHLGSAFGRPTLTLFGPTNPLHWNFPTPISRNCYAGDYSRQRKPLMSELPEEPVVQAALDLYTSLQGEYR